jgi:hypothetical protein
MDVMGSSRQCCTTTCRPLLPASTDCTAYAAKSPTALLSVMGLSLTSEYNATGSHQVVCMAYSISHVPVSDMHSACAATARPRTLNTLCADHCAFVCLQNDIHTGTHCREQVPQVPRCVVEATGFMLNTMMKL